MNKAQAMNAEKNRKNLDTHKQRIIDIDKGRLDHIGGKHLLLELRTQSERIVANGGTFC